MLAGKKVLITGHTGQIAHAVAKWLAPRCELWGLARYSKPGSWEMAEQMGLKPVKGSFTTPDLGGVPTDFDFVVHFAANTYPLTQDEGMVDNAEGVGLLMAHCRSAKAFLHVSTTGVYSRNPDHLHRYKETDRIGGATDYSPFYGGSKTAGEGVVRAVGRILDLPTTIARMNVAYGGAQDDGGLPGGCLERLVKGEKIRIPKSWPCLHMPIHEDDISEQVEPLLAAADLRSNVLNWGGDDVVSVEEFTDYMGQLTGLVPDYDRTDENPLPQGALDNEKRLKFLGPCKVKWRDGFRRMVEARHPELKIRAT
jgi:UDP-glucuronate 4-epimerase